MVVGAQESVYALRAMPHVAIGRAGRVVPMVVLARRIERGQVVVDRAPRLDRSGLRAISRAKWDGRSAGERRAHQDHRAEHVRPDQRAPGRHRRAEVVADDGGNGTVAERRDEPQRVPHQVEDTKGAQIAIVVAVPAGGAAIAALVGGHHVKPLRRQRQHHLAPAVGELREAVQKQEAGPALGLEPGLQHVHPEAVAVVDEARAYAVGQGYRAQGSCACHSRLRNLECHRAGAIKHRARGTRKPDTRRPISACGCKRGCARRATCATWHSRPE